MHSYQVVMSVQLDIMFTSIVNGQVPPQWARVAYESRKTLGPWIRDLHERVAALRSWLTHGEPKCFWLSGFFFPQVRFAQKPRSRVIVCV